MNRITLLTLVACIFPTAVFGNPFDDLKNKAESTVIDAVKNQLPTNQQQQPVPTSQPQPVPTNQPDSPVTKSKHKNQANKQGSTNPTEAQNELGGGWYSQSSGIGVEIRNGKGISTVSNRIGHKVGDTILEIASTSNHRYSGKILAEVKRNQLGWIDFKGSEYDGNLTLGLSDRSEYRFSKGNAPKLSEPYSSGVRYIVGDCAPNTWGIAVIDSAKVNFRKLPTGGSYKFEEAPNPLPKILAEAHEFMRSNCGENAVRVQYPIYFQSSQLPSLPFQISDFDKADGADAKVYISSGTASLSNRRAGDVIEEQRKATQKAEQKASADRASVAAAQKADFLKKNNAVELKEMGILWSNPFSLEGKTVAIPVNFYQMTSPTTGRFEVLVYSLRDSGGSVTVSDIPKGTFLRPVRAFLAAKVMGLKPAQGVENAEPQLKFVSVVICDGENSWCH